MSHQKIQSIFEQGANMMYIHIVAQVISSEGLHPIYKDTFFMDELIRYFAEKEEYEKCERLVMIRVAFKF
jgi:hypothetical protein